MSRKYESIEASRIHVTTAGQGWGAMEVWVSDGDS